MHQAVQGEVLGEAGAGSPVAVIEHRLVEHRRSGLPDGRGQVGARGEQGAAIAIPRRLIGRAHGRPVARRPARRLRRRPAGPGLRAPSRSCAAPAPRSSGRLGTGFRIASPAVTSLSSDCDVGTVPRIAGHHAIQEVGEAVGFGHDVPGQFVHGSGQFAPQANGEAARKRAQIPTWRVVRGLAPPCNAPGHELHCTSRPGGPAGRGPFRRSGRAGVGAGPDRTRRQRRSRPARAGRACRRQQRPDVVLSGRTGLPEHGSAAAGPRSLRPALQRRQRSLAGDRPVGDRADRRGDGRSRQRGDQGPRHQRRARLRALSAGAGAAAPQRLGRARRRRSTAAAS